MPTLTTIILAILTVFYIGFYIWVWKSPVAKEHGIVRYGPMVMFKTQVGIKFMEKYGKYTRFWRFYGTISLILSFILMVIIIIVFGNAIMNIANVASQPNLGIEYVFAIPGLNPMLPLTYGVIALIVSLVIHEMAHGLQSRANNIKVNSTGLLYGIAPLGAFVEPDVADIEKAPRKGRMHMYSAGITTNLIAGVICFILFSSIMMGTISSPYGDNLAISGVVEDSPAYDSGIPAGSIITEIEGVPTSFTDMVYTWSPGDLVTVSYLTEDGAESKDVRWGLYIHSIVKGSPADGVLKEGWFLTSITIDGETTEMLSTGDFSTVLKDTLPGDVISFTTLSPDGEEALDGTLTLGDNKGRGFVGVVTSISGMSFISPDLLLEKAKNPFANSDSFLTGFVGMISYLSGPFNGMDPLPDNVTWWYDVPMEGIFWILLTALYWIFWLNIVLGLSNALPALPFDGGHLFNGWLRGLLDEINYKTPEDRDSIALGITSNLSVFIMFLFVILIFTMVF